MQLEDVCFTEDQWLLARVVYEESDHMLTDQRKGLLIEDVCMKFSVHSMSATMMDENVRLWK